MPPRLVRESLVIPAPPDVIFNILADPRQHSRIDGSGTVGAVVKGPQRLALGSEFAVSMKMIVPYRITNKVVEFEEGRLIAWQHMGRARWRYELDPVPEGTRVTETFDYSGTPEVPATIMTGLRLPERNRASIGATLIRLRDAAVTDAGQKA